ncbi:hypothetical protein [Nostoc sp. UHCC 0251]|uniref:hypothetical protein n=1 Tax=Nostoc sp. UHCC 0251 TaxID=3110240 RepID=UPI002B1EDC88|nr:hypothetical protein [Nostoc sp. UHCC 0251]MEA5622208.1 hypothetical protein [Nostoc sp. UHCC 0251]
MNIIKFLYKKLIFVNLAASNSSLNRPLGVIQKLPSDKISDKLPAASTIQHFSAFGGKGKKNF